MIAITVGFLTTSSKSEAKALYVGPDGAEALRIAQSNPPGFEMCHVYKNPAPVKRTFPDGSGELPKPAEQTLKLEFSDEFKAAVAEAIEAAKKEMVAELKELHEKIQAADASLAEKETELADLQRLNAELQAALDAASQKQAGATGEGETTSTEGGTESTTATEQPAAGEITEGQPPLEGLGGSLKSRKGK
jgi:hypothetical protein